MTFILSGWEEGFDKVGLNVLLREYAGLGLRAAKEAVDEILEERPVSVEMPEGPPAQDFLRRARELGCRIAIAQDGGRPSDRVSGPISI